ncbi:MAG: dihydropteroate synthase [Candidatus Omnitrophica bacterium]|nr:dihydropteroate synthase [Candidatus Omnitrophota bacterium]
MFIIGELINGMYKNVGQAIRKRDKSIIQEIALKQIEAGVDALDLNCGPLSENPLEDMCWLVETVQEVVDKPLCLDSSKPRIIEAGLKIIKNKAIINSTSADLEKLEILVDLAKRYNAKLIGLTLSSKGVPQNKEQRLELAAEIVAYCSREDFSIEDLYLDPVVLPINVAQDRQRDILDSIQEFKVISEPPPKTIVGLSNISQGASQRPLLNRTFITMAISFGLDAAILNPLDNELINAIITSELILNRQIYCESFLKAYRKR